MISQEMGARSAADLLKIGELRDLEPVEQHLPADAPRAERRRLPVVLLEANVVLPWIDAARLEALEIELLHLVGRRLEDDLVLMMFEDAIRILPEASVIRPARRLHVGHTPRLLAEYAEQRLRVRSAGADFEIERLLQQAAVRGPEGGQFENEILKRHSTVVSCVGAIRAARDPISSFSPDAS